MLSKIHFAARMVSFYSQKAVGTVNKQASFGNAGLQRYRLLTTTAESGSVKAESAKGSSDFSQRDLTRVLLYAGGMMLGGFGYLTQVISKSEERTERNMSKIEQELKHIRKEVKQGIEDSEQRLKQHIAKSEQGLKQDLSRMEQSIEKLEKSVDKLRDVLIMNLINNKTPASLQVPSNNIERGS